MSTQALERPAPDSAHADTTRANSITEADDSASPNEMLFVSRKGKDAVISEHEGVFIASILDAHDDRTEEAKAARHLLLTVEDYEARLRAASSTVQPEGGNMVTGWHVASLAVNHPNEDKSVVDVLPLSGLSELAEGQLARRSIFQAWKSAKDWNKTARDAASDKGEEADSQVGELLLSSVIDGHGNNASVAALLQRALHVAVAQGLASLWEKGTMKDESEVCKAISDTWVLRRR